MPFIDVPGLPGKLYVPEAMAATKKKHACPDCFSCQHCGDDRCQVCRCGKMPADRNAIHIQEGMNSTP
ncbi:MAG: hypothetical protein AB1724_10835 [Thermodesulfobacteriota bacterium]